MLTAPQEIAETPLRRIWNARVLREFHELRASNVSGIEQIRRAAA